MVTTFYPPYSFGGDAMRRELVESRRELAQSVGVVPQSFAYPFGARARRLLPR